MFERAKKVESIFFISTLSLPIFMFFSVMALPDAQWPSYLVMFSQNYLGGDGFFIPSAYPDAAVTANGFSVGLAILAGVAMGVYRSIDFVIPEPKVVAGVLLFVIFAAFALYISITPQEFKTTPGRSFGRTEAFHNFPIFFLLFIVSKASVIYFGFRFSITVLIILVKNFIQE